MNNKNKGLKILSLKKKLIIDKNKPNYFSFTSANKKISKNYSFKSNTKNNSLTKKKSNKYQNKIKIKYKGISTNISKSDFFKMKNVDISKLIDSKFQKIELIKQKKLYMEKENDIFNTNHIDLMSDLKEKEYREEITNLQMKLYDRNLTKKEILLYFNILSEIVKDVATKITSDIEKEKILTKHKINFHINQLDIDFEKTFNKNCEFSDYFFHKLKELIKKICIIINDHQKLNERIANYNNENFILKKKLRDLNYINNNICMQLKKKEREKNKTNEEENFNDEEKQQQLLIYKKINNSFKINFKNKNREDHKIIRKKFLLNNDTNIGQHQTNFTSNNINLLTSRSNYNNLLSLSNNIHSMSTTSFQNQDTSIEKIKNKEINYINKLKNKIKILKNKVNQLKLQQNKPINTYYNLIMKIINQIYKEEDNIVVNNINYKFLGEHMRLFPYQNLRLRKKFMNYILGDNELFKIYNTYNTHNTTDLETINDFVEEKL